MLNKAEYASSQGSVSSYFHKRQKFTAEMKGLSALRIGSSIELIIIPLLNPNKISNQIKTFEFHPVDTSFHSPDDGYFLSCFSFPLYNVLLHGKLKHKNKTRNLGSIVLVFKLNIPAFRLFIKGTGCKLNNKHWSSRKERSGVTDLAQNTA